MNRLKIIAISSLVGMTLWLSGCTAVQVKDRIYLQALELNTTDQTEIQLHDFMTASSGAIATVYGDTLSDALAQSSAIVGKELFLGHLELLAYTSPSDAATLNQWMTQYRLSPSCLILGLPDGDSLETLDTTALVEQLQSAMDCGLLPETNLYTILTEFSGSAGMALVPVYQDGNLSMAIITEHDFCTLLSDEAVKGLSWLRGDSEPTVVILPDGEFSVTAATTRITATVYDHHVLAEITIRLSGSGDFDGAAAQIQAECKAAIQETIVAYGADVIGFEACLQSECYRYLMDTGWAQAAQQTEFQFKVIQT